MALKIVTDSLSDIPAELAKQLDITVVPLYIVIDDKSYRDRIDITDDEFYHRLVHDKIRASTSQPSPSDFIEVYDKLGEYADGIISIHATSGMSGTVNSAEHAKSQSTAKCPIAVIDSQMIAVPFEMIVIAAAKMAKAGCPFQEVVDTVKGMLSRIHILALFDTLEYLARGGRIGKARSLVGSLLNIKPLLTIKDGIFTPVSQARSKPKAKERLLEFVNSFDTNNIESIGVTYSTNREEILELINGISVFPTEQITISRLGPVIGSHTGPGLMAIAVITRDSPT
ncbi:MAG: DegV family protein [Dehalococcoidia bacterium]|nr:DegV family protein [Dehalococcoidia bacterium]